MEMGEKETAGVAVGVGSLLFGWLGGVWSVARKVTQFQEQTTTTLKDHTKRLEKHAEEIEGLRQHHDEDLAAVRNFFSTASGGQKFMTFPDHDLICLRNSKVLIAEMQHLTKAVESLSEKVEDVGEKATQVATSVAVLEATINKG